MQQPLVDRIPFAKIVIGLVLVMLLSLGLCGLTLVISSSASPQINKMVDLLGPVVAVGLLGSLAGLLVTCVAWGILAAVAGTASKVSQPEKLSTNQNDTNLDKDK